MSALSEYEEFKRDEHFKPSTGTIKADVAIESLKCCGNCGHLIWRPHRGGEWPGCGVNDAAAPDDVDLGMRCYFCPSRWTERDR